MDNETLVEMFPPPSGGAPPLGGGIGESPLYSGQTLPLFESQALYYSAEGEQLGRGPWPLKPGETTRIMVFWKIQDKGLSFGAPKDSPLVVSGELGPNVQWTGFAPIGKGLFYEPKDRIVKWFISGGSTSGGSTSVFEIAIAPTASQIQDNQITVVDNLKIQEKDARTGKTAEIFVPNTLIYIN